MSNPPIAGDVEARGGARLRFLAGLVAERPTTQGRTRLELGRAARGARFPRGAWTESQLIRRVLPDT